MGDSQVERDSGSLLICEDILCSVGVKQEKLSQTEEKQSIVNDVETDTYVKERFSFFRL